MIENKVKNIFSRKGLLGISLSLVLAIIVLNVDKRLWLPLELETINARNVSCRSAINHAPPKGNNVVVILFDDRTQFLLRENGLPIKDFEKKGRRLIAKAIEQIKAAKAKAIGININLSTPSNYQVDDSLAKTVSSTKNIVIADSIYSYLTQVQSKILSSTNNIGYGELFADFDKVVHKIKLVDKSYKELPSFSYTLYKLSKGIDLKENLKQKNEFYLKYTNDSFITYSFIDLISGKVKAKDLQNKIVILGIGLRSKLMKDQLLSPIHKDAFISDSEVQAVALSNLLNNSYLFKVSLINKPFLFVLISIILGGFFSVTNAVRRLTVFSLILIILTVSSQILYSNFQLIIELVPLMFLLLGNLIIGSLIYLQLNLQEQNIELEEAIRMLNKRGKELESSQSELKIKNTQLTNALSELSSKIVELKEVRKLLSTRSEEERKRIARELHDDTLARLTDLKRHIEGIINVSNLPLEEKKRLGVTIQTLENVSHEIRRIINALRPSMLDNALGLIPALENLLDDLSRRSSYRIKTKITTSLSKLKLTESEEINVYRIIQEALNNVFKHSMATNVEVVIEDQFGQILFLVKDNGIGIKETQGKKGYGLIDIQERAELIGANVQYINNPYGSGTALEIAIPHLDDLTKKEKELSHV